jgi:hypothetical protein
LGTDAIDPVAERRPGIGGRTSRGTGFSLTPRQWAEVERRLEGLQGATTWHGGLPVLLLERCWLRLSCAGVEELLLRLPPDSSREAPELVLYRQLIASGQPSWQAQQHCWDEFGAEACRQAQRRLWVVQDRGNHGWTLEAYLSLVRDYRRRFREERPRRLPLLVLARGDRACRDEPHRLFWLGPGEGGAEGAMRHTCA